MNNYPLGGFCFISDHTVGHGFYVAHRSRSFDGGYEPYYGVVWRPEIYIGYLLERVSPFHFLRDRWIYRKPGDGLRLWKEPNFLMVPDSAWNVLVTEILKAPICETLVRSK